MILHEVPSFQRLYHSPGGNGVADVVVAAAVEAVVEIAGILDTAVVAESCTADAAAVAEGKADRIAGAEEVEA